MKDMKNLTIKNSCFGEIDHESTSREMKDKALLFLMFMTLKRNGDLKTRGVSNGNHQRLHAEKKDCISPILDFHAFKCVFSVTTKEGRDVAIVDLSGFSSDEKRKRIFIFAKVDRRYCLILGRM